VVPLAVLGASQVVSYIRAKADVLGIDAKGGVMERGERIFVLCASLVFSWLMLWLLWLVFALSCVTAAQRFVKVWRQAGKPPAPLPVEPTAVTLRWRAWREERAGREPARWARGTRRPSSPASGGFFVTNRRPGSEAAASRRQARLARRQRFSDQAGTGAGGPALPDERGAPMHDGTRAKPRRVPGQD
jgi:hypothetical protein